MNPPDPALRPPTDTAADTVATTATDAPASPELDRYAVLGHPVAHSQSPFIHAAFAAQTGQTLHYGRLDCPPGSLAQRVRDFADGRLRADDDGAPARGGRGRGCNITVPLKFEVLPLAAQATPRAQLAQAANTLRLDTDGQGRPQWLADNTDGIGLVRDLTDGAGLTLVGARVLLIGAGGAAAGVLGPLLAAQPAELVVANRSADRAEALVLRHRAWAADHGVVLRAAPLAQPGAAFDLVINGTASSLAGEGVPVPASVLRAGTLAVDLMYGPAARTLLHWAEAAGAQGRDGLGMLVEQAAESFALWRGVRPQTAPVLAALRARLAAH